MRRDGECECGLAAAHCLTLEVNVTQKFVGETPGGYRVDFYYSARDSIEIPARSPLPLELQRHLRHARVTSGSDWATVSSRGVIDFDSRITLALGEAQLLVAGKLRGRAQLSAVVGEGDLTSLPVEEVVARWRNGFKKGSYLPLVLSAAFDVPSQGYDDAQTRLYEQSRALANSLFIGDGKLFFQEGQHGNVQSLALDLYLVAPTMMPDRTEKEQIDEEQTV